MPLDSEQPLSPESAQLGYEPSRANFRGLTIFLIVFVVSIGVIQAGVWLHFRLLVSGARAVDEPKSAVEPLERFPEPDVQPSPEHNQSPYQDLADMRQENERTFQTMGWTIDPKTSLPVIPARVVDELTRRYAGAATQPGNATWPTATSPRTSLPVDMLGTPSLQSAPAAEHAATQPVPPQGGNRQ